MCKQTDVKETDPRNDPGVGLDLDRGQEGGRRIRDPDQNHVVAVRTNDHEHDHDPDLDLDQEIVIIAAEGGRPTKVDHEAGDQAGKENLIEATVLLKKNDGKRNHEVNLGLHPLITIEVENVRNQCRINFQSCFLLL